MIVGFLAAKSIFKQKANYTVIVKNMIIRLLF
ncbi:conserved domain protein (plasmid) [Bacillus anthracis str. A0488]|uniref:Conserved domain protein n=1 Tax=Bacillus anthracis TaxID=1392 RepID=Q6EZU6_BACAN|nr:hypothetical protein BX_A0071 [Bacillus anthracis str. A2012]AAT28812.2 conserved domain protein [Bacillus anthracis str. 'Ames Ancestor']EDR16372.1 conserved domain protein [Bacillus anthracis str. A0488]EDR85217.1 conserved domain protein [Bacillus anthracis str. A0193]EDR90565.1 conserved domain protein [Bacillus anthracis str. A0442]EDS94496.1 conserved domain protein [Bacillus anthracis str. A0389]EDT17078.1 conserved domain protein [Bacillus anthracis str. A0465]EDT64868.1 conserved